MRLFAFLLRSSRGLVALSVVSAVVGGGVGVALIAIVHDELAREHATPGSALGLGFAALCVLAAATRAVAQAAMVRLGQRAVASLSVKICREILGLPLERFEALDPGKLVAVLTEDVVIVGNAVAGVPQVCLNAPVLVLCFAYVGWLSPVVMACGLAFAAVGVGVYVGLTNPALRRLSAARASQDALVNHFQTLIHGFRELKLDRGKSRAFLTRAIEPGADAVRRRVVEGQTLFALAEGWGVLVFFGFLGVLVFALPALARVDRPTLVGAVLVVMYVIGPLDVVITWLPTLGRAGVSLRRVEGLIPTLEGAADASHDSRLTLVESLDLKQITYDYPGDSGERGFALGPVDLSLRPGEIVILAGGNGGGKTTLVKVLTGLYRPAAGSVLLDGRPIGDDDRDAYRQLFSVVFADGHVFKAVYGVDGPECDAELKAGLLRMNLADRVTVQDGAFSTTKLSQGQRGRLALLTALAADRPVCVFDEWAANQDPHFKRAFYREILPSLRARGKAVLVISHDEEYYDAADRVVRLRDGLVAGVELGAVSLTGWNGDH